MAGLGSIGLKLGVSVLGDQIRRLVTNNEV